MLARCSIIPPLLIDDGGSRVWPAQTGPCGNLVFAFGTSLLSLLAGSRLSLLSPNLVNELRMQYARAQFIFPRRSRPQRGTSELTNVFTAE